MAWALRRLGQHNELPKRPPPCSTPHPPTHKSRATPTSRGFGFGSGLVLFWFCFGSVWVRYQPLYLALSTRVGKTASRCRGSVLVRVRFCFGSVVVRKSCSSASGLYRRSMSTDEFVTRPRSPVRDASRADAVGASQPISAVGKPLSAASDLHRRSRGIQVTNPLGGLPALLDTNHGRTRLTSFALARFACSSSHGLWVS